MLLMSVAYSASAQSLVGKWTTNLKTVEGVVAERSVINEFDAPPPRSSIIFPTRPFWSAHNML